MLWLVGVVGWGCWLELLVGAIGIAENRADLSNIGPTAAITFLTVFYGYFFKIFAIALALVLDAE